MIRALPRAIASSASTTPDSSRSERSPSATCSSTEAMGAPVRSATRHAPATRARPSRPASWRPRAAPWARRLPAGPRLRREPAPDSRRRPHSVLSSGSARRATAWQAPPSPGWSHRHGSAGSVPPRHAAAPTQRCPPRWPAQDPSPPPSRRAPRPRSPGHTLQPAGGCDAAPGSCGVRPDLKGPCGIPHRAAPPCSERSPSRSRQPGMNPFPGRRPQDYATAPGCRRPQPPHPVSWIQRPRLRGGTPH